MIKHEFSSFTVLFKEYPTMDNYHKISFNIHRDGGHYCTVWAHDCGFNDSQLLASESEADVKEGIQRVVNSRNFWTNRLKHLI